MSGATIKVGLDLLERMEQFLRDMPSLSPEGQELLEDICKAVVNDALAKATGAA
jgi:hypothetical protein